MDKRELKEQFKQYKPDMGIISFKCLASGKQYLHASKNIKADINSATFQLNLGSFITCKNLQADWKKFGESGFEISVIENLENSKDETKSDYSQDLKLLRDMCAENLSDFEFINK